MVQSSIFRGNNITPAQQQDLLAQQHVLGIPNSNLPYTHSSSEMEEMLAHAPEPPTETVVNPAADRIPHLTAPGIPVNNHMHQHHQHTAPPLPPPQHQVVPQQEP